MLDVTGTVRYRHLGILTQVGVDLRAEVGLLSRNIRIHGEMEDSCYGDNLCNHFSYDTFGGHIQVYYYTGIIWCTCATAVECRRRSFFCTHLERPDAPRHVRIISAPLPAFFFITVV